MRRIYSFLLAAIIFANIFTICGAATSVTPQDRTQYYEDEYYELMYDLYDGFMNGTCWNDYLANNKNFVYPQVKDRLENNRYFQFCLSSVEFLTNVGWADLFTGEYDENDVKVQYYVTALSSLLMTMEDNWSDVKAVQAKADATMDWQDYLAEFGSVTAGSLSAGTNGAWETAFETCGMSIDILGSTIDTLEDYQTLESNASAYVMYHSLLEIIIKNTTDPLLSQAAQYLLNATDLCYIYRMEHFDMIIEKETDAFFSVLDKVIEQEQKDSTILSGEWAALNCLSHAAKSAGSFKLGVDIGKFIWDVIINASDTMLRWYEMCALSSVREALIKEITKRDAQIFGQEDWEEIFEVRDLLMNLLCVNVRGEYCAYMLLTEDAGILSTFHTWINGEEDKEWFNSVLEITNNLKISIEDFIPDWENFKKSDIDYDNFVTGKYDKEESATYDISTSEKNCDSAPKVDYEMAKDIILKYYNNLREDDGVYIISEYETIENEDNYLIVVRYQMSDKEAEEKISQGGFPAANILVDTLTFDKITGSIFMSSGKKIE